RCERCFRRRIGADGRPEIVRYFHVPACRIGALPAAVGFGRVDLRLAERRHATFADQPLGMTDIALRPDAFGAARAEALQEGVIVEGLLLPVDPAPAERDVERFRIADRRHARLLLEKLEPDLAGLVVLAGEPARKARRIEKGAYRFRID